MRIALIDSISPLLEAGIEYFWEKWGNESNFDFYKDCIENSLEEQNPLPKFYLMLDGDKIIGSYALIINDLISRQDLYPWLACLFVEEEYRNQGLAGELLQHSMIEAKKKGFDNLYLSTDLEGFYEKKGWEYYAQGYNFFGNDIKIYHRALD